MRETDDAELLDRIRRGDRGAFDVLVRKYIDRIAGVAARALNDREEALDVAQEVFTLAWTALQSWKDRGQVFSWLYRTTLNLVSHRRRKRQIRPTRLSPVAPAAPDSGEELTEAVKEALESLPERQREVFVLRHEAGLPLAEIGRRLNLAEGTVKIHLHRALLALREILKIRRFL